MQLTLEDVTAFPPDIVDDATRREFIIAGAALAGLLATGCSGEDGGSTTATSSSFPRTVTHVKDTTEIPARPERVYVASGTSPVDCLLSLGVVPVVIGNDDEPLPPWQQEAGAAAAATTANYEPNIELLASERIDLAILNAYLWDDATAGGPRIRELAPSVAEPDPFSIPAVLDLLGRYLGLEARAAEVIDRWRSALAGFEKRSSPLAMCMFLPRRRAACTSSARRRPSAAASWPISTCASRTSGALAAYPFQVDALKAIEFEPAVRRDPGGPRRPLPAPGDQRRPRPVLPVTALHRPRTGRAR